MTRTPVRYPVRTRRALKRVAREVFAEVLAGVAAENPVFIRMLARELIDAGPHVEPDVAATPW